MKKYIILIILSLPFLTITAQQAINPLKVNIIFRLDGYGNSNMEVSTKLNAAQWDIFKQKIGNNVAILKRQMERSLPTYFLTDFNYSEESMERIYTLKFKALGVAKFKNKDRRIIEMDSRNPDVTQVSEGVYMMSSTYDQGGMLMQETSKIIFPKGSKDIKVESDSFGKAVFTYTCPTPGANKSLYSVFAGVLLIIGSGSLFYRKRLKKS